jgi:hypothetical protein
MEKLAQIGQISDLVQPSGNLCYYQIKDLWSGLIWNWTQITAPILVMFFELGTYVHMHTLHSFMQIFFLLILLYYTYNDEFKFNSDGSYNHILPQGFYFSRYPKQPAQLVTWTQARFKRGYEL